MVRPVDADPNKTRMQLIQAATQIFVRHGFGGAGLRDGAESAELSLGMVRHYFGSKQGLHEACIRHAGQSFETLGEVFVEQLGRCRGVSPKEPIRRAYQRALAAPAPLALWCGEWGKAALLEEQADHPTAPYDRWAAHLASSFACPASDLALVVHTALFTLVRVATQDRIGLERLVTDGRERALEAHVVAVVSGILGSMTMIDEA